MHQYLHSSHWIFLIIKISSNQNEKNTLHKNKKHMYVFPGLASLSAGYCLSALSRSVGYIWLFSATSVVRLWINLWSWLNKENIAVSRKWDADSCHSLWLETPNNILQLQTQKSCCDLETLRKIKIYADVSRRTTVTTRRQPTALVMIPSCEEELLRCT